MVDVAAIEITQCQQNLRPIQVRIEFEGLSKSCDRTRIAAQHVKSEAQIRLCFRRPRIDLHDFLIDLFRAVKLLSLQRRFSLRRKIAKIRRLRFPESCRQAAANHAQRNATKPLLEYSTVLRKSA